MRILHITPAYYPATFWGGPIFSVYALNNALASLPGVELKVLSTDSAGPQLTDCVKVKDSPGLYPGYEVNFCRRILGASVSLELLRKLVRLIRWAEIVHLTAIYSFPTLPTLILCRLFRKPLVWSPRGAILDSWQWKGSRNPKIKRTWEWVCSLILLSGMVKFHVTSEYECKASCDRFPQVDAVVVPNGVEVLSLFPHREWTPERQLRLLFIGRLSPKKGIENLLHAMKLLVADKGIELVVCGTGDSHYCESLIELASELDLLDKSVNFVGHVDGDDKRKAFLNADICVVPSYTESFCMVVAEALGHGVPVVTSHGTPWAEAEKRNCGLWVDNSPEELVKAIRFMRTQNLPLMGRQGWQWMRDEFGWDVVSRQMLAVYREMI